MAQIDFNRPISERNEVLNKTHANALPSGGGAGGRRSLAGWCWRATKPSICSRTLRHTKRPEGCQSNTSLLCVGIIVCQYVCVCECIYVCVSVLFQLICSSINLFIAIIVKVHSSRLLIAPAANVQSKPGS